MGDHRLSEQIKDRWHEACFKVVDAPSATNAKRRAWEPTSGWTALKSFVRKLASEGDGMAKEWLSHKKGSLNQPRSDANIKAAREACAATKLAHRKSKSGGGAATAAPAKGGKGKGGNKGV